MTSSAVEQYEGQGLETSNIHQMAALSRLIGEAHKKCQDRASKSLGGLDPTLKSTGTMIDRIWPSLARRYDWLLLDQRQSLSSILYGLKMTIIEVIGVLDELPLSSLLPEKIAEKIPEKNDEQNVDKSGEKSEKQSDTQQPIVFGIFRDVPTAAATISMWRTALNIWMFTAMRPLMESQPTSQGLENKLPLTKDMDEYAAEPLRPSLQVADALQKWLRHSGPMRAQLLYRYGSKIDADSTRPDDVTELTLCLSNGKVSGTAVDMPGKSTIEGEVDMEAGTIKFLKKYGAWNLWAKWEYNGHFTPWGIFGVWHRPGSKTSSLLGHGRFILWLMEEEEEEDDLTGKKEVTRPSDASTVEGESAAEVQPLVSNLGSDKPVAG